MWNSTFNSHNNDENGGGGGGGGFVQSPGNFGSQATPGEAKKEKVDKQQNVIPCTIAQIHKLSEREDEVKVGSVTAHLVTLIGLVVSVEEVTTKIMFRIDDMTGPPFLVQLWTGDEQEKNADSRSKIIENSFVRVTGTLRSIQGNRQMIAFKVTAITDVNEMTMHMLEIMHSSMAIAIMDEQPSAMDTSASNLNTSSVINDISEVTGVGGGNAAPGFINGLSAQQNMVFQAILPVQTEDGVDVNYLVGKLPSLDRNSITTIVEYLSNEGHIYSTTDDDHFKATDYY